MASMKGLVENECGSQNTLLKLTSHFTTDRTLINQDGIKVARTRQENDLTQDFVNEYLNENSKIRRFAPNNFQMETLFNEILHVDSKKQQKINNKYESLDNFSLANDWADDYIKNNREIKPQDLQWSTDYLSQTESLYDDVWENKDVNIENPKFNEKVLNEEMKKTANELLDSMQDSRFSETEFLSFVENLKNPNTNNKNDPTTINDESLWMSTFEEVKSTLSSEAEADKWVNEFKQLSDSNAKTSFWDDLNEEWNLASKSDSSHPWLDDFQKIVDSYKTYEFDNENPLLSHPNPFEEGLSRLKSHDIVNAVLLFEAAVQKEPENFLCWQYLGTTQVENEQDAQAIRALRKCLELKPDNLIGLSTLATCYTNESMQKLAYDCLFKWLKENPKYNHIVKNKTLPAIEQPYMSSLSIVHIKDFIDLQETYLEAIRESSNEIDPDIQCCLGILFHLSNEFDKAADCFKTSILIKPDDPILWNKLGATYANSNRNEEAIDAYYQALKLCPGFVRARYNLGIGCMNLGAYKEAVEHFLTALSQQNQSLNNIDQRNTLIQMSETIWSTLRLALSYLNKPELYSRCANRDLYYLKKEFNIE